MVTVPHLLHKQADQAAEVMVTAGVLVEPVIHLQLLRLKAIQAGTAQEVELMLAQEVAVGPEELVAMESQVPVAVVMVVMVFKDRLLHLHTVVLAPAVHHLLVISQAVVAAEQFLAEQLVAAVTEEVDPEADQDR